LEDHGAPTIGCPDFPLGYPPDFAYSEIHGVPVQKIHGSHHGGCSTPEKKHGFLGYVLNLNTSELAMSNTWPRAA